MFEWAEEFGADVLFAEHRYYGQSLPFGDESFTKSNIGYLRIEQTLADYARYLMYYQDNVIKQRKPVVVFGGSYGGILAALLRMKYPTVFQIAMAASAPLPQSVNLQGGGRSPFDFYRVVTEDARAASTTCPQKVTAAFAQLKDMFENGQTKEVQKAFDLCHEPKKEEWSHFMQYVRNAWTSMAMMDYPYPTNFLAKLPGWPVKAACEIIDSKDSPIEGLSAASALPYRVGDECLDMYNLFIECADQTGCGTGNDSTAWDFQMCSDITIIVASNNQTDMFPEREWTLDTLTQYCKSKYGTVPDPYGMAVRLGVRDFEEYPDSYSQIIFSNGLLDPWHPGGYLANMTDSNVMLQIPLGAHHLDLRGSHEGDPDDVKSVRLTQKKWVKTWLGIEMTKEPFVANNWFLRPSADYVSEELYI